MDSLAEGLAAPRKNIAQLIFEGCFRGWHQVSPSEHFSSFRLFPGALPVHFWPPPHENQIMCYKLIV